MNTLERLKGKVFSDRKKESTITGIVQLGKELGCVGEIIGREFEIRDNQGKIIYTIHQKPMSIKQFNTLMSELNKIHEIENESYKKGMRK